MPLSAVAVGAASDCWAPSGREHVGVRELIRKIIDDGRVQDRRAGRFGLTGLRAGGGDDPNVFVFRVSHGALTTVENGGADRLNVVALGC